MTIPRIDPEIKIQWVSWFRSLNAEKLRSLTHLHIIQHNAEPVAVLIPYAMYLELQASIKTVHQSLVHMVPGYAESMHGMPESSGVMHKTAPVPPSHPMEYPAPGSSGVAEVMESVSSDIRSGKYLSTTAEQFVECAGVPEPLPEPILQLEGWDSFQPASPPSEQLPVHNEQPSALAKGPLADWAYGRQGPMPTAPDPEPLPTCAHCNQPSDKDLCVPCFLAGHREQGCVVCAPVVEENKQ